MGQEGQRSVYYVDPKEFYREMCEFYESHKDLPKGERPPKIPDSIGKKLMLICERLSYSRQFVESPYREEMVQDAIVTCVSYIRNFDPSISTNPFSYFTQLAYYSFIQRAGKEKKEFLIKVDFVQNNVVHEIFDHANKAGTDHGSDEVYTEFANNLSVYLSYGKKNPAEENQKARPKRTTLAYQKKMKEKAEAEKLLGISEQILMSCSDVQIEEALNDPSTGEVFDVIKHEKLDSQVNHIENLL